MSAADRLDEIEARAAAATPGPWTYFSETEEIADTEGGIAQMTWGWRNAPNAAFIAAARTDLPRTVAALRTVLFQIDGDGDNCYRDDRYGRGSVVICTDVIRDGITEALGGAS